jgi:hypothetical protein
MLVTSSCREMPRDLLTNYYIGQRLNIIFLKYKKYIKSIKNILNKTEKKKLYVTQCYELGDIMKAGRRTTRSNNSTERITVGLYC